MERDKYKYIIILIGIIPVIWLGLLIAPYKNGGLISLLSNYNEIFNNPFNIVICEDSLKTVLFFVFIYFISIILYISTRKNYRRGEEYGSAKWGDAKTINKKYEQENNKILTQNVKLGLDGRKHRRNLNVLICGGSGAGKTRFYAKPNVMGI